MTEKSERKPIEAWRRQRLRGQWSLTWLLAVVFHELVPLLFGAPFDGLRMILFIIYFGVIGFLITWLFVFLPAWLVAVFLYFFGAFVEPLFFGIVQDFLLAGFFYLFLFALPYWLARRIWTPAAAAP